MRGSAQMSYPDSLDSTNTANPANAIAQPAFIATTLRTSPYSTAT
jgi:hypothetical protein